MTLSPFRYPGGKSRLLPIIMPYLNDMLQDSFSDGFVGGGSVLLEVASKYPNISLFANDKDYWIYCFWKIVSDNDRSQLDELFRLMRFQPIIKMFNEMRQKNPTSEVEAAYYAIFFNRTTFSGIATSGPIGGQEQQSKWTMDCRYNYPKLKSKIEKCHALLKGRTTVENKDIIEYNYLTDSNLPIYLDSPYFIKGDMLYRAKMDNSHHEKLADILSKRTNWVSSYDDCFEIRSLYKNNKIIDMAARYSINGNKTNWKGKNELIIIP